MRFMIKSGLVMPTYTLVIAGLACALLAGCTAGSSGSSSAESATPPGTSATSSSLPVAAVGCPLSAAAVSVAVKTTVGEVSVKTPQFQIPEPALCAFQTPSQSGLTIQIQAFPFRSGREKNLSLASIQKDIRASASEASSAGGTFRVIEHPEWGTDAFVLLIYGSGQAGGVEVWTTKYLAVVDPGAGHIPVSGYLADAKSLGDALVASK